MWPFKRKPTEPLLSKLYDVDAVIAETMALAKRNDGLWRNLDDVHREADAIWEKHRK